MSERALKKHCKSTLRALDLRPPVRVAVLCERLGARRGRPIRPVPYPLPVPGPTGLLITSPTADYVLYQQHTSTAHQDHIVLHELGHIIAEHSSVELDERSASLLDPATLRTAIGNALARTCYDTDREREAELVATIILERTAVLNAITPPAEADPAARRLQAALGERCGWR
ncbi:MAG TPA: hypothetical protein VHZ97_30545 [Pseudonocardiaceae bacterium]|jgi:hypothetical protein|nr:hypothetical protein [Pseudonocardiaceae bacterium]